MPGSARHLLYAGGRAAIRRLTSASPSAPRSTFHRLSIHQVAPAASQSANDPVREPPVEFVWNEAVGLVESRRGIAAPIVALTFDDGPSAWTDPIADELERHAGRGTFFAIGEAIDDATRRRTLRRLAERGHDLGNHTQTHPDLQTLADDEIRDELLRTREVLEDVLGFTPRYWRAPFLRCDERVREAVGDLGGTEVWFSSMGYDWEQPAEETARRVLSDLEPGDIVVLHDGRPPNEPPDRSWPTREGTVTAVGLILEEMTKRGLRSVTITELLESS